MWLLSILLQLERRPPRMRQRSSDVYLQLCIMGGALYTAGRPGGAIWFLYEGCNSVATCEPFLPPPAQINLRHLFCASACPETDCKADRSSSSSSALFSSRIVDLDLSIIHAREHRSQGRCARVDETVCILNDLLSVYKASEASITTSPGVADATQCFLGRRT